MGFFAMFEESYQASLRNAPFVLLFLNVRPLPKVRPLLLNDLRFCG